MNTNQSKSESAGKLEDYEFMNGYPTAKTIQKAYDDADLNRAIMAYRFFYPTVSIYAVWKGNLDNGVVPNKIFALLDGTPEQFVLTANSDTPYSGICLDLSQGPMVLELPPGPIMSAANDLNQLHVMDIGMPGPDKGKGGKHVILPPGYKGTVPSGYYTGKSTTNRVLVLVRALPQNGDMEGARELMKSIKVYPLNKQADQTATKWVSLNKKGVEFTLVPWENNIKYWEKLAEIINDEPAYDLYRTMYAELAELGIEKGKKFMPDARMKSILEKAAKTGNAIMRVQSFADRRPERVVWKDRQWEWAVLRDKNGTFDTENYQDLYAREKWFYQAQIESPAMFNRSPGAGSLYWLGAKDKKGTYLDGSKTYKLTVPLPVPQKLFWSVTIYDNDTRSEIATDQNKAALRSLFELKDFKGTSVDLYFGPKAPAGKEKQWIKTTPGKGWFSYFRIYGPEQPAFDGSWRPGDFEEMK
ncbi:DUF1254 domain-containing protein [Methanolapillus millepedarum]|uniref:DUF1254 domain-containing protein n=1 Tax=Methanolapillus millepedarum TaxID=3028296 RepID=A0AA96V3Z6_9EURY|nr:hypothetical protein MsAc7_08020 [Methanosarcinaceae archaeon Ac7]